MREIKAIIRPHRLDAVLEILHTHPELPGVTVSSVRGFGQAVGRRHPDHTLPVQYGTVEMIKLECIVNEDEVDTLVDLIQQAAHTGNPGDGKISVHALSGVVRIRTGERMQRIG